MDTHTITHSLMGKKRKLEPFLHWEIRNLFFFCLAISKAKGQKKTNKQTIVELSFFTYTYSNFTLDLGALSNTFLSRDFKSFRQISLCVSRKRWMVVPGPHYRINSEAISRGHQWWKIIELAQGFSNISSKKMENKTPFWTHKHPKGEPIFPRLKASWLLNKALHLLYFASIFIKFIHTLFAINMIEKCLHKSYFILKLYYWLKVER